MTKNNRMRTFYSNKYGVTRYTSPPACTKYLKIHRIFKLKDYSLYILYKDFLQAERNPVGDHMRPAGQRLDYTDVA